MSRHFESLLALALLASACDKPETDETNDELGTETSESDGSGSSSSTDDAESSSSSDTTETGDGVECECIAEQPDDEIPVMPLCGEMLCPTVTQVDGQEGVPEVATLEALECALTALRDRTPGIVTWDSTYNGGQFSETGYVLIYESGEAVWREWGANDLSYDVEPALRFELPDAAHYETCLANPIDYHRYGCLREYPLQNIAECEAGWSESSG